MAIMKFVTKNAPGSPFQSKYTDEGCYKTLVEYVLNPEKTKGCAGGWAVNLSCADIEMRLLAKCFHQEHGTRLRHWIVSFSYEELVSLEEQTRQPCQNILFRIAYALTAYYKDRYQIIFGIHWVNETSPHIHILMNTVSYMDGRKFHSDHTEYHAYEAYAKRVLRPYRISLHLMKDQAATKML